MNNSSSSGSSSSDSSSSGSKSSDSKSPSNSKLNSSNIQNKKLKPCKIGERRNRITRVCEKMEDIQKMKQRRKDQTIIQKEENYIKKNPWYKNYYQPSAEYLSAYHRESLEPPGSYTRKIRQPIIRVPKIKNTNKVYCKTGEIRNKITKECEKKEEILKRTQRRKDQTIIQKEEKIQKERINNKYDPYKPSAEYLLAHYRESLEPEGSYTRKKRQPIIRVPKIKITRKVYCKTGEILNRITKICEKKQRVIDQATIKREEKKRKREHSVQPSISYLHAYHRENEYKKQDTTNK